MFDLLPDVLFWIKDKNSCIVHANEIYIERFGFKSLKDIQGKSDYAFSPAYLAKQYITDDQKVMAGELVTERLEMNTSDDGGIAWFVTSKRPVYNDISEIVGSYGITRYLEPSAKILSDIEEIKGPVDFIRENFQHNITVEQLAQHAHLSVSALERRFRKYLAKTPNQFINEVRLENSRRLIVDTSLTISEIAYRSGFSDHSYFSRQFKALFDELPSELRLAIRTQE
ncbi:AraC family transcriptional regulator [Agarilytica rhodophyticola]|uniref:AraC family transcriptional regulator n=1 Tax=Agarilytica rhodophyticola TaxID=1737490 RepID=UPI001FEA4996|nr:AraC family transcriptional regulator [Agarilytica rhodophyticola]